MATDFSKDLENNLTEEQLKELAGMNEKDLDKFLENQDSPIKTTQNRNETLVEEIKKAIKEIYGKHKKINEEKIQDESKLEKEAEEKEEKDKEEQDKENSEEVEKDGGDELIVEDKSKEEFESAATEKGYLDRAAKIHNLKIKMYREQLSKDTVLADEEMFMEIVRLEHEQKLAREELGDNVSDKFKEQEKEYIESENAYQKKIRDNFIKKATSLDKLTNELNSINKDIEKLKKFQTERVTEPEKAHDPDDYNKKINNLEAERLRVLIAIYDKQPEVMQNELAQMEKLDNMRDIKLGRSYDLKRLNNLDDLSNEEMKKNMKYAESRQQKGEAILEEDNRFRLQKLEEEKHQAELDIERLEGERENLPKNPTTIEDIEKVALITRQLADAKVKEENLDDQINAIKNGEPNDEITEEIDASKESEDQRKKVDAGLKEVDEAIETAKEKADEERLADPINNTKTTKEAAVEGFVIGAAVTGGSIEGATKGAFIGAAVNEFQKGLQAQVYDPDTVTGAAKITEEEQKQEVSKDLREVERQVKKI